MFIAKGLLVKGLAGLTAFVGAGGTAIIYRKEIKDYFSSVGTSVSPNSDINTKITTLGLPEDCKFSDSGTETTKECSLDEAKLKEIKFSNKETGDLTVDGTVSGLKLSIKKLQDSDKARYGSEIKVGDLWFTFKDFTADITIKKDANTTDNQIKLIKGTNPEFKINNDKLEKAWTVTTLGEKVGLTCPATAGSGDSGNKCTVETGKQISYKNSDNVQQLTTSSQVTDGITYEEDTQDYNQGFKFTVSTAVSGNDNTTLATGYYEIKYEEGESKGWYLFKKGEIAQAGGGGNGAGNPTGTGGQETNSANTAINNKITETLKLPEDCKFTESDTSNPKECSLDEAKLKKIEFKDKDGDLTVEGSVSGLKLSIKKLEESDKARYGDDITVGDPWFTFKDFTENIKVKKSDSTAIVSLIKGTNPEFKINDNKLEKAWSADSLAKKVGLKCCDPNSKKCTIQTSSLKFSDDGTSTKNLTLTEEDAEKITYTEDQENYNQGFKFTVSAEVTGTDTTTKLAAGNYEIKYDSTNSWYFFKKTEGQAQ